MTFDSATFNAAFASDPQTVKATVAEMARQIGVVTKDATAATSGQITRALAEKQSSIDSLNRRISDWDDKLTARQTLLTQIYSKINANLATLKTTSDWISQQITVLTTKSTG
jgi:flagellar hook-associated protein 2